MRWAGESTGISVASAASAVSLDPALQLSEARHQLANHVPANIARSKRACSPRFWGLHIWLLYSPSLEAVTALLWHWGDVCLPAPGVQANIVVLHDLRRNSKEK